MRVTLRRLARAAYRSLVSAEEHWYRLPPGTPRADLGIVYMARGEIAGAYKSAPAATINIDLSRPEEDIFAAFSKSNRYKIRRAKRHGVAVEAYAPDAPVDIATFAAEHDKAMAFKNRDGIDVSRLHRLRSRKMLHLSISRSPKLSRHWASLHAHVSSCDTVRLLLSASNHRDLADGPARTAVADANRCHHWDDMRHFKARGFKTYDFGGWYDGNVDKGLVQINEFKQSFGGEIVRGANVSFANGVRGKVAAGLRNLAARACRA